MGKKESVGPSNRI